MKKLVIQIPCYNEADDLPKTLAALPVSIPGVDQIELLVIDDGSVDGTAEIARQNGVHHIVRHNRNRGLAAAFQSGLVASLRAGADIVVNTDGDGQYPGAEIPQLVQPILEGRADIVIGDRNVGQNEHFGPLKRRLQVLGNQVMRRLAATETTDAVSGFRAISAEAARRITITSDFSYTTDMLIQAGRKRLAIVNIPVRTNKTVRPSRLFRSIPDFITQTGATMLRVYATYSPLKTFATIGAALFLVGVIPIASFLWQWLQGDGQGHIQSLVLGGSLVVLGVIACLMSVLAELIGANRKLIETTLEEIRLLERRFARFEEDRANTRPEHTDHD